MAELNVQSIFDIELDRELQARLDAQAEADFGAGRIVPHAKVVEWLNSWGSPDELPCPTPETR